MRRPSEAPEISVVICTRDRSAYLASCLRGLERQSLASSRFEVWVIDNGSTDATPARTAEFTARNAHFHYHTEPRVGLSIARNTGARISRADIIAYIDDDAVPDPSWLERLCERFRQYPAEVGIVGGDVIPVWEAPRPDWLVDALLRPLSAGLKWSTEARFLRPGEWLVEVNSAYRKPALERVGGFPEALGRMGSMLLSGDGAVNLLIEQAGYLLFYDPQIIVQHHIPASRVNKSWFRRRSFWQGVSLNKLHRYVEDVGKQFELPRPAVKSNRWEKITVPTSAAAWASLFDDTDSGNFYNQLYELEQLGYLFESQSLIVGR
jgi:glycosyltransferase involved in cell wall biosynthesis